MKKLIVMLAFVVAGATMANAQTPQTLGKGQMIGQVGLNGLNDAGIGINASLEYGLNDALFGQEWLGWGWGGSIDAWFGDLLIVMPAVRTALHFQAPIEGLDIYIGARAGLSILLDPLNTDFDISGYLGVRYFFTPTIGAYIESGYGNGGFGGGSLGVTFRF